MGKGKKSKEVKASKEKEENKVDDNENREDDHDVVDVDGLPAETTMDTPEPGNDQNSLPEPIKSIMEEFHDIQPTRSNPTQRSKSESQHSEANQSNSKTNDDNNNSNSNENENEERGENEGDGEEHDAEQLNLPPAGSLTDMEVPSKIAARMLPSLETLNPEHAEDHVDNTGNEGVSVVHDIVCPDCSLEMEQTVPICCINACNEIASAHLFCGIHASQLKAIVERQVGIDEGSIDKSELNEDQHREIVAPASSTRKRKHPSAPTTQPRGSSTNGSGDGELNLPSIGLTVALGKVGMTTPPPVNRDRPLSGLSSGGIPVAKRRKCEVADCQSTARLRGRCIKHGGGRQCSIEGCLTSAYSRGLCVKHGGGKRCVVTDCDKSARYRSDFCKDHANERVCEVEGCEEFQWRKRLCKEHLKRMGSSPTNSMQGIMNVTVGEV